MFLTASSETQKHKPYFAKYNEPAHILLQTYLIDIATQNRVHHFGSLMLHFLMMLTASTRSISLYLGHSHDTAAHVEKSWTQNDMTTLGPAKRLELSPADLRSSHIHPYNQSHTHLFQHRQHQSRCFSMIIEAHGLGGNLLPTYMSYRIPGTYMDETTCMSQAMTSEH